MDIDLEAAKTRDQNDDLAHFREKFHFPTIHDDLVYLNGNSLGLQPKNAEEFLIKELQDWKKYGVEGHFEGDTPWLPYHELLTPSFMKILGAEKNEVVAMNTLTTNLHLMMVSFYRPTNKKHKILVEYSPFPSDMYAVKSQIRYHGFDPKTSLVELRPDNGEIVSNDHIQEVIEEYKDELALIMMGGVNYYTGQTYDMKFITELAHSHGITVGFDLAHAAGNVNLELHDWGVDFAVFCTYKYLNSGPGAIAGAFVHNKHANADVPRFAGWWGHDKETRFKMGPDFNPIPGAEGWQLSNPPVLSLAAIRAAMVQFDDAGMSNLIKKSKSLVEFARSYLSKMEEFVEIITPDEELSGAQLSLVIKENAKEVHTKLIENGVICDWREPNVIRVAFAPLYNNYTDVAKFVNRLYLLCKENQ